jgi:hypothetical protein
VQQFPDVANGLFVAPDHEYPAHLKLLLTAKDSGGLQDTGSVRLDPQTVGLKFKTSPAGLRLFVGSDGATTPFSPTVIVGSKITNVAPAPGSTTGARTPTIRATVQDDWTNLGKWDSSFYLDGRFIRRTVFHLRPRHGYIDLYAGEQTHLRMAFSQDRGGRRGQCHRDQVLEVSDSSIIV